MSKHAPPPAPVASEEAAPAKGHYQVSLDKFTYTCFLSEDGVETLHYRPEARRVMREKYVVQAANHGEAKRLFNEAMGITSTDKQYSVTAVSVK